MSKLDFDGKTNFLIYSINECLDIICPVEKKVIRDTPTNYLTTTGTKISTKINENMYKKSKNLEDKAKYKERKKILDRLVRGAKNMQIKSDLKNAGTDAKKLWSSIRV